MNSETVTTFTDVVSYLLPALIQYAAIPNDDRTPEDEAMIRQLRVAAGAIGHALMETPRPPPQMPNVPRPPDGHAATASGASRTA